MRTLENAVVVVTGAGKGIGHAIAEECGRGGARIVVNYSHSKDQAEELVKSLMEHGARGAIAVQADVSDPDQAVKLVEETINQFGRIDVLVNNAGINIDRTIKNMSIQEWRTVIETDLSSYFYTTKAAFNYFAQQKGGAIINISSLAGQIGNYGQANYSAAKAGILGLTKAAACELARYNVTVNAICAGPVGDTGIWDSTPPEVRTTLLKNSLLNRPTSAHEVARAVRYLYEDGECYTGATLSMNGGWFRI
jgi:acetoacetyl-CoA reductase